MNRYATVTLKSKTHKGKNIITNHGDEWRILKVSDNVLFSNETGRWFLISSNLDDDARWIHSKNDENFEVIWRYE